MNWALAFQVARFIIWIVLNVNKLVVEAEQNLPKSGRGSEKSSAVKQAITMAGKAAGLAEQAIDAAYSVFDVGAKIDEAVAKEINGQ